MTPDTSNYMIAGFLAIFLGLIGYLISLITRTTKVQNNLLHSKTNRNIYTK